MNHRNLSVTGVIAHEILILQHTPTLRSLRAYECHFFEAFSTILTPDRNLLVYLSKMSKFRAKAQTKVINELNVQIEKDRDYIRELEQLLKDNGLEIPQLIVEKKETAKPAYLGKLKDGSPDELSRLIENLKTRVMTDDDEEMYVEYRDLTVWNTLPDNGIPTVGSALLDLFCGGGEKKRFDLLYHITGRIKRRGMTLVMGPPGCGKTTFLKALSGQLNHNSCKIDGEISYNGDSVESGKYLLTQVCNYIDERDQLPPTLTVREVLDYAFNLSNEGKHMYGSANKDEASSESRKKYEDEIKVKRENIITLLGLSTCADTVVGGNGLRGISGGQK